MDVRAKGRVPARAPLVSMNDVIRRPTSPPPPVSTPAATPAPAAPAAPVPTEAPVQPSSNPIIKTHPARKSREESGRLSGSRGNNNSNSAYKEYAAFESRLSRLSDSSSVVVSAMTTPGASEVQPSRTGGGASSHKGDSKVGLRNKENTLSVGKGGSGGHTVTPAAISSTAAKENAAPPPDLSKSTSRHLSNSQRHSPPNNASTNSTSSSSAMYTRLASASKLNGSAKEKEKEPRKHTTTTATKTTTTTPPKATTQHSRKPAAAKEANRSLELSVGSSSSSASSTPSAVVRPDRMAKRTTPQKQSEPQRQPAKKTVEKSLFDTDSCDQMDQMESVMDYLESITQALGSRTRSLPPPASLESFRATVLPQQRTAMATASSSISEKRQAAHFSLLEKLYEASRDLLRSFSELEYAKLSQPTPLEDLERGTLQACTRIISLVETVERKFCMHEDADVREAFTTRRHVVDDCQEVVDTLIKTCQHIVLLRRVAAEQNISRVMDLYEELKTLVKRSAQNSKSAVSTKYQLAMLKGPFFAWLEQRWIPAMTQWRQVVLRARQNAAKGDVHAALQAAEREALTVPHLQDILRPNETISDLHQTQIVKPLSELVKTFDEKNQTLEALRRTMECPSSMRELAKAIRAAQVYVDTKKRPSVGSSGDDGRPSCSTDEGLLRCAQQMLVDMQQVESITNSMQTAHKIKRGDAMALFHVIHRANELINRLGIAQNPSHAQRVVRASRSVVSAVRDDSRRSSGSKSSEQGGSSSLSSPVRADSLVLLMPASLSIHDLCLSHELSDVWVAETSAIYQDVVNDLFEAYTQESARRDLERALEDGAPSTLNSTGSPHVDLSLVQDETSSNHTGGMRTSVGSTGTGSIVAGRVGLEELKSRLQRAEQLGLSGPLVEQAKERLKRMQTLKLKVRFESQTRIIPIQDPESVTFSTVYDKLYAFCCEQSMSPVEASRKLRVRYEDQEGDFISIFDDQDWLVMLSELTPSGGGGGSGGGGEKRGGHRVELYCDFLLLPGGANGDASALPALGPESRIEPSMAPADLVPRMTMESFVDEGTAPAPPRKSAEQPAPAPAPGEVKEVVAAAVVPPAPATKGKPSGAATTVSKKMPRVFERLNSAPTQRNETAAAAAAAAPEKKTSFARTPSATLLPRAQRNLLGAGTTAGARPRQARTASSNGTAPREEPGAAAARRANRHIATQEPAAPQREGSPQHSTNSPLTSELLEKAGLTPDKKKEPEGGDGHVDLTGAKRWEDEEADINLEIHTVASMSTMMPGRQTTRGLSPTNAAVPHFQPTAGTTTTSTTTPAASGAPRNTFTTTDCRRKKSPEATPPRRPQPEQASPFQNTPPKRWTNDEDSFNLDEIRTVYSDVSSQPRESVVRSPMAAAAPATNTSTPPSPATATAATEAPASPIRTPNKTSTMSSPLGLPPRPGPASPPKRAAARRGARGTPMRVRGEDSSDEAAHQHRDPDSLMAEMQQMRKDNQRAMDTRRQAWH